MYPTDKGVPHLDFCTPTQSLAVPGLQPGLPRAVASPAGARGVTGVCAWYVVTPGRSADGSEMSGRVASERLHLEDRKSLQVGACPGRECWAALGRLHSLSGPLQGEPNDNRHQHVTATRDLCGTLGTLGKQVSIR